MILYAGLVSINVLTIVFIVLTATDINEMVTYVDTAIVIWIAQSAAATVLLLSAVLTVVSMRELFGSEFKTEQIRMVAIVTIFVVAYLTQTIFSWVTYYKHKGS
jgi:hypothetical protein